MSKRYTEILLEDMNDKLDVILEYVVELANLNIGERLASIENRLGNVESILEMTVKNFSSILENHETRLNTLESNS
ncbi:MAG: hypothetical protein WCK80_02170 [bacterium]